MSVLQPGQQDLGQSGQLVDITNTFVSSGHPSFGETATKGGLVAGRSLRDDSGCELMDDSLTDMRWLQKMDAGEGGKEPGVPNKTPARWNKSADFPGLAQRGRKRRLHDRNKSKDGCRKKLDYSSKKLPNKPPLSYASIIALAICSAPQRMMTLSSIYQWIEGTFPFYRTPESKAWKNSIRHNLSIRKNMFMKVYQYPPRRGNGSFWTLLSDGEEELKRAIPLFSTLLPPIIDENSIYNRVPSTHTVKSKGQYVPVFPNMDGEVCHSYVSMETTVHTVEVPQGDNRLASGEAHSEVVARKRAAMSRHTVPRHLLDHSYAKQESFRSVVEEEAEGEENEDSGRFSESSDHETTFDAPTPKRKRLSSSCSRHSVADWCPVSARDEDAVGAANAIHSPPSTSQRKDDSFNLLETSFFTPVKNLPQDLGMPSISLSPLYDFITPRHGNTPLPTSLPSPFMPLESLRVASGLPDMDSGVFSTPFKTDPFRFSTPLSPFQNLLSPSNFAVQQGVFPPLKDFDSPGPFGGGTPYRLGSLQPFGLPGLTPPSGGHRTE